MIDEIEKLILDSSEVVKKSISLSNEIEKCIKIIINCFVNDNKVILFGNGGSAADAQHIAAEFIGRFKLERKSFPAIALTTDTSILTSLSNDYTFDMVFSRQCESLVSKGDVVIGITTSGNSKNVIEGIKVAKQKGAITIGLLGNEGGILKELTDISIIVNSSVTSEIQEVHRVIYHVICKIVERELAKK
jgi:D-sedoheptulose 7-phosphate isomerase